MKRCIWVVLIVIVGGCAAASPPVELTALAGPDQQYSGLSCPTGCVAQYGVTNPYILETDITYLQLSMWRYREAVEAALEAGSEGAAKTTILEEARADVLRLAREHNAWWEGHALDQSCFYCGPVCQEMNLLLLHSPVSDSYPICPDPASSSTVTRLDQTIVVTQ